MQQVLMHEDDVFQIIWHDDITGVRENKFLSRIKIYNHF